MYLFRFDPRAAMVSVCEKPLPKRRQDAERSTRNSHPEFNSPRTCDKKSVFEPGVGRRRQSVFFGRKLALPSEPVRAKCCRCTSVGRGIARIPGTWFICHVIVVCLTVIEIDHFSLGLLPDVLFIAAHSVLYRVSQIYLTNAITVVVFIVFNQVFFF